MVEIFPGSGFQGKPPKPKSLSETFEEIKDIAKGVGIGESFDLAGAPADITDAFFSARKALFPYSDLGEQKAAEKLAQGIGAEALIKKAGVDVPEFGFCITPETLTNNAFAAPTLVAVVVPAITIVKSLPG